MHCNLGFLISKCKTDFSSAVNVQIIQFEREAIIYASRYNLHRKGRNIGQGNVDAVTVQIQHFTLSNNTSNVIL